MLVQPSLVVSSTTPMSLPKIDILCYVSLFTRTCQILDFCQTPTNPIHLPSSRWYNPDKRCDVMLGSSAISMGQLQEFQFSSCHVSLFASICQIPDFYLTPTNPMQPPFSRWYNPDKRCDVMVGSSTISSEQLQELSLKVGEQEIVRFCEGECHWLYCPQTSSE